MRQKIFIFLLTFVFVFTQVSFVEAKGSSGGRSSGGRSSSSSSKSSGGYSGSSSSKSSGGFSGSSSSKSSAGSSSSSSAKSSGATSGSSTGSSSSSSSSSGYSGSSSSKSSSGYTGSSSSSSRSVPGTSSSSSSSSGSTSGSKPVSGSAGSTGTVSNSASSSKTTSAKSSYMQDTYKKQMSSSNYNTYKQNLNADQQKVYESASSRSYNVNNRMNFDDAIRTRPQRINVYNSRPIYVNINTSMFGGPFGYGSAFVGPWDMWFLMRASEMFWFHHWHDIHPYRDHFNAAEFARLEARVKQLEAQNMVRDPNYLEPGVDPDLQFSPDYQQKHLDNLYYTNKYSKPAANPVVTVVVIILIVAGLVLIIRAVSRPRPRKTYNSRIY